MQIARSLSAILLLAAALHAQPQGATVEGKVISTQNGGPVRHATVLLRATVNPQSGQPATRTSYMTQTDANGHFVVTGLAPGPYTAVPSRQGFGAQPPDVLGPSYYPTFNLREGDHITDLVLRLTPTGVISGRVLDPDNDPISGAQVEALQYGYVSGVKTLEVRRNIRSDDRGEYRLFSLFPGQYYLRVSKPDTPQFQLSMGTPVRGAKPPLSYSSVYYPNTGDSAQAAPIDVPASGELRGVDVRLSLGGTYSIRGKLGNWNPQGSNININIQKRPRDSGFYPGSQWRLVDDGYVFENVAPGSYVITATLTDRSGPGKPALKARQFVQVASQDVSGVDLSLAPAMEVTGTVRASGTAPITLSNIRVVLMPIEEGAPVTNQQGGSFIAPVKADGTFTVANLFPDQYQIRIAPANVAYATSMQLRDQALSDQRLDLSRGPAGPVAIVVAADFGKIEGTVKDDQGRSVAQSNVTLIPDQSKSDWGTRYNNNVTDAQGKFYFNNVVPGNYQLFAWQDNPRGAPANREFRKPFERYALSVKLEPGGHPNVEMKLIPNQEQTQSHQ